MVQIMNRYSRIVFVSTGGTCRSVLAKAIYSNLYENENISVESRGTVVLFSEPANPKAVAIAKSKGIDINDEKSVQLSPEDFGDDTLVIVMTDLLKKKVYEEFENAVNVYSVREFTGEALDVEAAFGGELVEYGNQYEYLEKLVVKIHDIINENTVSE